MSNDYLFECTACENHVPFDGMRCIDCFVGTTTEFLFEYVPEFAVVEDDDPDLPNLRSGAVSGAHVVLGVYDRKGGPDAPGEPEWLDQMLHVEQAEALIDRLEEVIEQTDEIPDQP